jgi:GNAT superfamily N-acetyltransferase
MREADFTDLGRLHQACLPDSTTGALGLRYLTAFYRYLHQSSSELLIVERRHDRIVAAAAVSLEPATLQRRLLGHTPLLSSLAMHPVTTAGLVRSMLATPWYGAGTAAVAPEMILLYTAVGARGQGIGAAIIGEAERQLRDADVKQYTVKTVLDAANPALAFYRNRGFIEAGTIVELGRRFQQFTRTISGGAGARP